MQSAHGDLQVAFGYPIGARRRFRIPHTIGGSSPGALEAEQDPATVTAAWRLLEAGETLCISQLESVGFRMLLKRAHELANLHSKGEQALQSIEDLAQLLALWKPGT